MRAVLTNFGTMGDLQPFLALACEMRRRGHEPALAFSPTFKKRIEDFGIEFFPVGEDLQALQRQIISMMLEVENTADQLRSLFGPLIAELPRALADLREACRAADVLVGGPAQPAARMVHELTGINFVSVQMSMLYGGGSPSLKEAGAALINPIRQRLGLPALANPLTIDANSPQLALYAMSRHVSPPPADWPPHYHMTGYFFLDDERWRPDERLLEFINSGPPPVVITFGSATHQSPEELTEIVLAAVKQARCRAIIQQGWQQGGQQGWSGLAKRRLPDGVMAAGYAPHHWLFKRAACVVHHGGAGTAAAAYRAGTPSVFITHGPSFRAELARELGCVGPIVSYWELSGARLGAAISETISNPAYYEAARDLGKRIDSERGVERACQLIEALVAGGARRRESDKADDDCADDRRHRMLKRKSYLQQRRER